MDTKDATTLPEHLKELITPIGSQLRSRYEQAKTYRKAVEDRLLQDLRQYKGIYDPAVKIAAGRSRTYRRITRTKVKAMDARLMEMLFPANNDRNWAIDPTPRPDMALTPLAQALLAQAQQQRLQAAVEAGEPPRPLEEEEVQAIRKEAAAQACEAMAEEIDDQLKEVRHRDICGRVIHSGNLYGLGILKAPLSQQVVRTRWALDDAGQWREVREQRTLPYEEDVPVWDWYPDAEARDITECEVFHERHVMNRSQVLDLAGQDGFDRDLMLDYVKAMPNGDAKLEHWEQEIDQLSEDNDTRRGRNTNRFEVVEIWTSLTSAELTQMGLPEELTCGCGDSVWCCVWMLGQLVIKVDVSPLAGLDHPYHLYYFDKDESSIWGEGLAAIMRDDQVGLNAVVRASLDNAAATAGPITEIDVAALAPGESTDVYPNRKFLSRGTSKNQHGAVRVQQIQSRINEFLALAEKFESNVHEDTLPSYMHGDAPGGVGRTVGGLSMLMGAANINVKDQVRAFDDGITRPVITALYHWNMVYNPRPEIKGDYVIKARGSSSLVAKEVRSQQLAEITEFVLHPEVKPYCDVRRFAEEVFKVRDMGNDDILLDEETASQVQQLTQALQEQQSQLAQQQLLLDEMNKQAPALVRQVMAQAQARQPIQ